MTLPKSLRYGRKALCNISQLISLPMDLNRIIYMNVPQEFTEMGSETTITGLNKLSGEIMTSIARL